MGPARRPRRPLTDPGGAGAPARARARSGAVAGRPCRHDRQQRHLRRVRRRDALLGLLPRDRPRSPRGRPCAAVGLRRGRAQHGRRRRGGHAAVRVPADEQPPAGRADPGRPPRVPRRQRAPPAPAVALQRADHHDRRPRLRSRPRGPADPLPAAVHDELRPGGLPHRQRLLRRRHGRHLERLGQDLLRHGVPARRRPPGRPDQRGQPGLHRVARLLRRGPHLRRGRGARRARRGVRRRRR